MAGHVVSIHLKEAGHQVDTLSARNPLDDKTKLLDVTDFNKLEEYLNQKKYDIVINCIGILVKQSEEQQDLAVILNSYLPHWLEKHYQPSKTRIIHLSTDCVFSGKNPPYKEDSDYDGQLFYDRAKALGEIINSKDLTFRMSIIGPDMQENGIGLFNWFYKQSGEVSGFTKAMWSGITTIELAKGIENAIEQNLTGLYQLVPKHNISKFDLLKIFKEVFYRDDITIIPSNDVSLDKTLINTRTDFEFDVSDYQTMIKEMHKWIENHKNLYPQYTKQ